MVTALSDRLLVNLRLGVALLISQDRTAGRRQADEKEMSREMEQHAKAGNARRINVLIVAVRAFARAERR